MKRRDKVAEADLEAITRGEDAEWSAIDAAFASLAHRCHSHHILFTAFIAKRVSSVSLQTHVIKG